MSKEPSNETLFAMLTSLKELVEVRFDNIESLHKQHIDQDNKDHAELKEHILTQNSRIGKNEDKNEKNRRDIVRIMTVGSIVVIILPIAVSLFLGLMK